MVGCVDSWVTVQKFTRSAFPFFSPSDTFVIRLFDRSVDLAQFTEDTPLYPVCRAWLRNAPGAKAPERPSTPTPSEEVAQLYCLMSSLWTGCSSDRFSFTRYFVEYFEPL